MSPIYEYACRDGCVSEQIRAYAERDQPLPGVCPKHGLPLERIFSAHHAQADGIYSYAPNLGSEEAFERKRDTIRKRKQDGGPWATPVPEEDE